jgi:outer membrane PBP1 activator LpoA protein
MTNPDAADHAKEAERLLAAGEFGSRLQSHIGLALVEQVTELTDAVNNDRCGIAGLLEALTEQVKRAADAMEAITTADQSVEQLSVRLTRVSP